MGPVIYTLCAMTAAICAFLLLQTYRRSGYRLLLWSGLCFVGLTINNILLVLDKVVLPDIDFLIWRSMLSVISMSVLLYGLIRDAE